MGRGLDGLGWALLGDQGAAAAPVGLGCGGFREQLLAWAGGAPPEAAAAVAFQGHAAELPISSRHAVDFDSLPPLYKDPFDRLLLAQAIGEGITLVTADGQVARYPGPVRKV